MNCWFHDLPSLHAFSDLNNEPVLCPTNMHHKTLQNDSNAPIIYIIEHANPNVLLNPKPHTATPPSHS